MEHQVELPGNRTAWADGKNLRPSATATTTASTPKAGVPPKPGMTSCAGKIEGRYTTSGGGFGSVTITFRAGKATLTDLGATTRFLNVGLAVKRSCYISRAIPNWTCLSTSTSTVHFTHLSER